MAGEWTGKKKRTRTRDVAAEGLYIASAATRLSLKNTILVHILADGEDFDAERYVPEARAALKTLALTATASRADLARAYKALVRRYHPDANAGDRSTSMAGGQESARFRGEGHRTLMLQHIERLDAEGIADQPRSAVGADQAKRVHAAQALEGGGALLRVDVQQRFEVRSGGQLIG